MAFCAIFAQDFLVLLVYKLLYTDDAETRKKRGTVMAKKIAEAKSGKGRGQKATGRTLNKDAPIYSKDRRDFLSSKVSGSFGKVLPQDSPQRESSDTG